MPIEAVVAGPPDGWELLDFDGSWEREYFAQKRPVGPEGMLIEQRRGRSTSSVKPFWVLRNRRTQRGMSLALAYMGNWSFAAKLASDGLWVRVDSCPSGLKPFLKVEGMPIPGVLVAEFKGAWDAESCRILRFASRRLLRDLAPDWPPVQYNTWYAYHDGIDEAKLLDAVERAEELGCELFVVDAGCYGGASRASDWNEGLGDWTVNRERLPRGLEPIEKLAHSKGMTFGMWIEIECAHPSSPIAQDHPDWFLAGPGGERIGTRDVLDFSKSEVLDWAKARLTELVETHRIDYIKMDMNVDPAVDDAGLEPSPLARHY